VALSLQLFTLCLILDIVGIKLLLEETLRNNTAVFLLFISLQVEKPNCEQKIFKIFTILDLN